MRLPQIRIKLWRSMIVIAIVAVLIWGEKMRRLRAEYLERAAAYKREADFWHLGVKKSEDGVASTKASLAEHGREAADVVKDPAVRRNAEAFAEFDRWTLNHALADLHKRTTYYNEAARLERKYERAARYPWFPVSFDPPLSW